MKRLKIFYCFIVLAFFVGCDKEEDLTVEDIPGLGGDTWVQGPIDNWIKTNLTTSFNIAVKYKWDQFELELNKTLVPPREDKVVPVMSAVKDVWIAPYVAEAGDVFLKKYAPKYFVLVGSPSFNSNGTITLGQAEGGRKVVLFDINNFRIKGMPGYVASDSFNVKEMFHTIHHEFGHILHQNVLYPEDYKRISVGLYTANWNNVSTGEARSLGFITPYSMSSTDEDFVEIIATMLVEGRAGFNRMVNSVPVPEARTALRQKEAMVVTYFKQVWNIDFYRLQTRTRTAIEGLIR